MRRATRRLAGVAVLLGAAALGPTAAGATGGRVGPHQPFVGEINGALATAIVRVICPGPSSIGHALAGQTIAVLPAPVAGWIVGNTGAGGRRIVAVVSPTGSAAGAVVFTRYGSPLPFPTTVPVPCSGTSTIPFVPEPATPDARAAEVTVSWVNIAATPGAVSPVPPRITLHPRSVMVGGTTRLDGTGFAPDARLRIEECSQPSWVVTQRPCDTANAITVQTDDVGGFHSPFTALTCAATTPTPAAGFVERCYVGNPVPVGIDEIHLLGAALLTVTGP